MMVALLLVILLWLCVSFGDLHIVVVVGRCIVVDCALLVAPLIGSAVAAIAVGIAAEVLVVVALGCYFPAFQNS